MKKIILLNPGAARTEKILKKLVGSRLGCAEIEGCTARDIEFAGKLSIFNGTPCELTEIFSRSPVRYEDRLSSEIRISNEIFVEELMDRVFDFIDETEEHIYLMVKPD